MRRATLIMSLSVSAVALVAIVYGTSFRQPPDAGKSPLREVGQPRHAASADTQPDASTVVVTQPTENDLQKGDDHESSVVKEARRKTRGRDEATTREWVIERATRDVKEDYALLLEHLDLTSSEKEALLEFLIEDKVARTRTRYASGEGLDEQERLTRLADILGDAKLQQFLALQRNIGEYREVQRVQSMLDQKGVPLTDTQQDRLLKILIDTRGQFDTKQPAHIKRNTFESLDHILNQLNEYERLVLELVPSVLSAKQVEYVFERYQAKSDMRADSWESQARRRADNPNEDMLLVYPHPSD